MTGDLLSTHPMMMACSCSRLFTTAISSYGFFMIRLLSPRPPDSMRSAPPWRDQVHASSRKRRCQRSRVTLSARESLFLKDFAETPVQVELLLALVYRASWRLWSSSGVARLTP